MIPIITLLFCVAVLWWAVRGLRDIGWQAAIAQDMHALLDQQASVCVYLSERQIVYLRRWDFVVEQIEPAAGGLWYSEVTR